MIGMTPEWMRSDDAVSIFNLQQPSFALERIPPSLRPTPIQLQVPHHPWLDFFPFPRMRDLLILAGDAFDDDELCHDLMAFWDTRNSAATLLVWGDSWDPKNWEVTEKFAHKWTWMIRDSPELLASTNFWRRSRGEKPLDWKPPPVSKRPCRREPNGSNLRLTNAKLQFSKPTYTCHIVHFIHETTTTTA
ncbi:hypothetical protein BA78_7641 [Aspergillus fumigatus]|nr:hypothetical protein BA78_7641 [Aspergillus fumigatus]